MALETAQGFSLALFGVNFLMADVEAAHKDFVGHLQGGEGEDRMTTSLQRGVPGCWLDPPGMDDITFTHPVDLFYLPEIDLLVGPEGEGDKLDHYMITARLDSCSRV